MALPSSSPVLLARSDQDVRRLHDFTVSVVNNKYATYQWVQSKQSTLVSINSIAIGGITALGISNRFQEHHSWLEVVLFVVIVAILGTSIALSFIDTMPNLDARIGNVAFGNVRVTSATETYTDKGYLDTVSGLSERDMVVHTCHQIKGMNRVVWRSQRAITRSTKIALVGFGVTLLWICLVVL